MMRKQRGFLFFCALLGSIALYGCPGGKPADAPTNEPKPPPANGQANAASNTPASGAGASVVKFTEVTEASGVRFRHQNSKTPRKYLIETMGSGGAFLDYDNDGWLDILLVNNTQLPGGKVEGRPRMALYHNNKNGTFADVTDQAGLKDTFYGMGVAVGDYDNDGNADFYVSAALGGGKLYRNAGNGTFQEVGKQAGVQNLGKWGTSCAWLDYDKDGKLDLFVCSYVRYRSLEDDQPCYGGDKTKLIYCIPSAYETSSCTLYHNEGGGKFKDVTAAAGIEKGRSKGLGVTVWDYDGDGMLDIFVANDTVPGFLFRNNGDGTFTDYGVETGVAYNEEGVPHSGMGIDADDAHNDGKTCLIITNYYGQQTAFYNQVSTSVFRDDRFATGIGGATAKVLGFGILFFDYDNDGWKDILQVNGHVQDDIEEREAGTLYAEPTLLFRNMRNGKFEEIGLKSGAPFDKKIVGRGVAWGDYDNDGKLDALITANNGQATLWRNETPTQNHWLKIKLIGAKSARDGIGATVTVTAGGVTRRTLVRSGSSYLSQSDLRPHFGLGDQAKATVEVRWASGATDKIENLAADRLWTIKEGTNKAE